MIERRAEYQHEALGDPKASTELEEPETNMDGVFRSPRELLPSRKPDFERFPVGSPPIGEGSGLPEGDSEKKAALRLNPNGLCALEEIAETVGYHPGHLRKLLKQSKVKGLKLGGVWLTTVDEVRRYEEEGNNMGRPRGPYTRYKRK